MQKRSSSWISKLARFGRKQSNGNVRAQKHRSLRVEPLEHRELLSVTGITTIGMGDFANNNNWFRLKDSDTGGSADHAFTYGATGWTPIVGDWDGDGADTIGVYDPSTSRFYLNNANSTNPGSPTISAFIYGPANSGWIPIAGDWNEDGTDTIGLYDPALSRFHLRNTNNGGGANITFIYGPGNSGWKPIIGDWNSDQTDTIALYNPANARFYLKDTNASGNADVTFIYGGANWKPLAGDWNGNGYDTIGAYDPSASRFNLRNTNNVGNADITAVYGDNTMTPITGNWTAREQPTATFLDGDVETQARSVYAAYGRIDRDGMIRTTGPAGTKGIFTTVGADSTVSANELTDCQMLVTNASDWGMSEATEVLTSNVVNGNPANVNSGIGNLVANNSSTKLNSLVDKWFKGLDRPDTGYSYQQAAGSLFVSGPSISDMDQSSVAGLGDCYFIAALGSIANVNSSAIENMFTVNGDGTYTVRFYYYNPGTGYVADYVTVDGQLPTYGTYLVYAGDGYTDAHPTFRTYSDSSNELWIALGEKAYAQWNETGRSGRPSAVNTYASIASGWAADVFMAVLGQGYQAYDCRDAYHTDANKAAYEQAMIDALAIGQAISMSFIANNNGLYVNHAYAVTGYNSGAKTFTLRNPWGHSDPGALTWDQLWSNAKYFFVVNGLYTNWYSGSGDHAGSASEAVVDSVVLKGSLDAAEHALLDAKTRSDLSTATVDCVFGSDDSFLELDLRFSPIA